MAKQKSSKRSDGTKIKPHLVRICPECGKEAELAGAWILCTWCNYRKNLFDDVKLK